MSAILATSGAIRSLVDGTLRLTVDIEPKDAQAAFALFGKPGSPVALARITNEAAVEHDRKAQAQPPAEPLERKQLSVASKVALTVADPEFHDFMRDPRNGFLKRWANVGGLSDDADTAEGIVKAWVGVDRKRDIAGNDEALRKWLQLHRDFQNWLGHQALAKRSGAAA
jgi:hypothetical protein